MLFNYLKKSLPLILIIVLFLFLNNLSYLIGFITAYQQKLFYTGATMINTNDHFYYLSQIEQGRQGHLFIENLYNPIAQYRLWFAPHWYLIGQFAKIFHLNNIVAFHLARLFLQIIFILILISWIKKIFNNPKQYWWMLTTLLFANGLSTLFPNNFLNKHNIYPTNLWMPESITFIGLTQGPLLILSQILILLTFILLVKSWEQKNIKLAGLASLSFFILGLLHPYDIPIILIVSSLWSGLVWWQTKNKNILKYYFIIVTPCILPISYYLWMLQDLSMQQLYQQNTLLSPNILNYLIGFGLISISSILALIYFIKNKFPNNPYLNLIIIWTFSAWLMIYLPLDFNRRLSNGWHVPLVIISIFIAIKFYKKMPLLLKLIFISFSIFFLIIDNVNYIVNANDQSFNYKQTTHYLTLDRIDIYKKISNLPINQNEVIMTRGFDGNLLPAFTGKKVYTGHSRGTWQAESKDQEVKNNWSNPQNLKTWLQKNKVSFIFASKENIPEFNSIKWLAQEPYIQTEIDNEDFILYKFINN